MTKKKNIKIHFFYLLDKFSLKFLIDKNKILSD
jgi:hypothetical protein